MLKTISISNLVISFLCSVDCVYLPSAGSADGCSPAVYRVLDDIQRSPSFSSSSSDDLLCDDLLPPGWYRLMAQGEPGLLPGMCPGSNVCGTAAPVWLKNSIPENGTQVEAEACVSWPFEGSSPDCCLFTIPVVVRNCGSFISYYLQPTQACSIAYCIQTTGNGVEPFDGERKRKTGVEKQPRVDMVMEGGRLQFKCTVGFLPRKTVVVWSRIDRRTGRSSDLSMEELVDGVSIFSPGILIQPGDKIACEVDGIISEPHPTGLEIMERKLELREDGSISSISVVQHSPVVCASQPCNPQLILQTRHTGSGARPPDVLLSTCSIPLLSELQCQHYGCGNFTVEVQAALDLIQDGRTTSFIDFAVVSETRTDWDDYFLESVQVSVSDIAPSSCHVFTDPHLISLDGIRFDLYSTGTFLLLKTLDENFEVHIRLWECNSGGVGSVSCTCGLVAREGADLVRLDMCGPQEPESKPDTRDPLPKLSMHSITGEPINIKVLESREGKVLTFKFASGRSIRVHLQYWGISLSLQIHGADHGFTRGLCGIFDGDKSNDLHDINGRIMDADMSFGQINKFSQEWRLRPGTSLFDRSPRSLPNRENKRRMCECQELTRIVTKDSDLSGHMYGDESERCTANILGSTQLLGYKDISPVVLPGDIRKGGTYSRWFDYINDEPQKSDYGSHSSTEPMQGLGKHYRISGHRSRRNPGFQADEEDNYIFPGDFDVMSDEPVVPVYPTKSGLTEEKIYKLCQEVIINSSLARDCGNFIKDVSNVLDICVLDVSLMDDTVWASYSLPLLETLCEEGTLRGQLSWSRDSSGRLTPPKQITEAINCPNRCSGNGYCNGRECVCETGYSSFDCSHVDMFQLDRVLPPYLYMAGNNSICDIRRTKCSGVQVIGQDFQNGPRLECRLRRLNSADVTTELDVRTTFKSEKQILCSLNPKDLSLGIYEVRISNDGQRFSNEVFFTVFDSTCSDCPEGRMPQHPTICKEKAGFCHGRKRCFPPDSLHPKKPCLICKESVWLSTRNKVFTHQNITLEILEGDTLTYNIELEDEQTALQLDVHPSGLVLEGSRIQWTARLYRSRDSTETVRVSGENRCRVKQTMTIRIKVKQCDCENDGECRRSDAGFICECPRGFSGARCEVSGCDPDLCVYGSCSLHNSLPHCVCQPGFKGKHCNEKSEVCSPSPCYPGVDCVEVNGSHQCGDCPAGLVGDGEDCAPPGLCNPNPCFPGVACTPVNWYFQCGDCPVGLAGDGITCLPRASSPPASADANGEKGNRKDPCLPNPCFTNVTCTLLEENPQCGPCPPGFEGDGIQCNRDFCDPSPCFGNVTCKSSSAGFQCGGCPPGFEGNGINCRDLCSDISCYTGVSCLVLDGSPVCGPCPKGMIGDGLHCQEDACRSNPCFHSVDCIHRGDSFECGPCPRGYRGDGVRCYRNPCLSQPCFPGVKCSDDGDDNFSCGPCPSGLIGNGVECFPPACLSSPCYPGVSCLDEPDGGYSCADCPDDLLGDGEECFVDPCLNDNPCYKGVSCYSFQNKAKCGSCPPGYVGNGVKCTLSDDPCSTNPCYDGVSCVNLWVGRRAGFVCGQCPDSLIGDGINCWKTDACSPNPCHPGVECQQLEREGEYSCGSCPPGSLGDGKVCHSPGEEIDFCLSNPCYPGVACKSLENGFQCGVCPQGMEGNGTLCTDINDCDPNPCYPGVSCEDEPAPGRGYTCGGCPPHTLGDGTSCLPLLQVPCPSSVRCYPGVGCVDREGLVTCGSCPPGMEGDGSLCRPVCAPSCNAHQHCDDTVCDLSTTESPLVRPRCKKECRNGGFCSGNNQCSCRSGWRGRWCNKPKCDRGCKNGGKCVAPNKCRCKPGFGGKSCKRGLCGFHGVQCLNDGRCRKNGRCKCQTGYFGRLCGKHANGIALHKAKIKKKDKINLIKKYLNASNL